MKKCLMIVAVAAVALLADGSGVWARGGRGGCGGGRGGRHGGGGCGGCGMGHGGCGGGGCGMGHGGYAMGGCMTYGGGGHVMGGSMTLGTGYVLGPVSGTEATVVVNLPADANLWIDGEATYSTSGQRVFLTPALEQGKEYEYNLKAKIERDGKTQVLTARVTVRPGETSQVELKAPAAGVAAQ